VVPVGLFVLAIATNLAVAGILFARFHSNLSMAGLEPWNPLEWFELNALLLADILVLSLWFAPVVAYQLLMSAWARSSVFIWTVLPPLALVLGERVLFKTWHVGTLIGQRLGMGFASVARTRGDNFEMGLTGNFDHFNLLGILTSAQLWAGVAVAAAFVFATIRIRRYRDDN
jgi:ABC-2 type transport system permease protein